MTTITFTIPGEPIGAPRMTQRDKWAQRPCVMRYRAWKDAARKAAGVLPEAWQVRRLSFVAYFSPPVSWSKRRRADAVLSLHRQKPDLDNIFKAVADALFQEDKAIASASMQKVWDIAERLEVTIEFEEAQP